MTPTSKDLIYEFIEANPQCTRKMLMEATNLSKETLGKNIRSMRNMFTTEIKHDSRNRPVEYYTINQNYDAQKVVIREFEPIKVKHHPLFAMYGMAV